MEDVLAKYQNMKVVATTLREVHSTNRHDWAAVLWLNGQRFVSPMCQLDILDRIGGGDGFASGLIYGMLGGRSPAIRVLLAPSPMSAKRICESRKRRPSRVLRSSPETPR